MTFLDSIADDTVAIADGLELVTFTHEPQLTPPAQVVIEGVQALRSQVSLRQLMGSTIAIEPTDVFFRIPATQLNGTPVENGDELLDANNVGWIAQLVNFSAQTNDYRGLFRKKAAT